MFYLNLTANGDDRSENLRERGRQQANDGPRARFRLRPGFVIQVSLEHSLSRSLLRSPSFHAEAAELGSLQQRRCFGLADPNTLIICPFAFASLRYGEMSPELRDQSSRLRAQGGKSIRAHYSASSSGRRWP